MAQNQTILQLQMLEKISKMLKQTFLALNDICHSQISQYQQNSQLNKQNSGAQKHIKKIHKKSEKSVHSNNGHDSQSQQQSQKKGGKKKKQAKWQLQGKPRPPLNAFMLFLRDSKFQIQQARPQLTSSQVSTYASTIWNDLPQEQKQKYRQQYRQNRKAYQLQLEEHKKKYGDNPINNHHKDKKKNKKSKSKHLEKKQVVEIDDQNQSDDDSMMI